MQWTIDRPILARRWWGVVIAVSVLAVLSGAVVGLSPLSTTVIVGTLLLVSALAWWRVEFLFLVLCLGTFGTYPRLVMENRLFVGMFPLSLRDLMAFLIIARAMAELISPKQKGWNPLAHHRLDRLMLAFFLYISITGVVGGVVRGNPIYGIAQGVRLLVYLYGGYLAGAKVVNSSAQVKAFIWIILLSNVAISLWQYYFLFAAPSFGQLNNPVGLGRWVRQYFLELPNTGLFLAIGLIVYRPAFLGRLKLWVLVITWGLSVIVSFYRNQWVCTGVALATLPGLLKDKRKVTIGVITGVVGMALAMALLLHWTPDIGNIYTTSLADTIRMSFSGDDRNLIYRIITTQRGWSMVLTNPFSALGGLGFGAQVAEAIIPEMEFLDWTDGYLWFLISTGLPGVAFLIILVLSFARASFHISRNSVNPLYRAFALAQCLYIIFELARTFVAGGFAYWPRAVYIGFILGLVASMYEGRLSGMTFERGQEKDTTENPSASQWGATPEKHPERVAVSHRRADFKLISVVGGGVSLQSLQGCDFQRLGRRSC